MVYTLDLLVEVADPYDLTAASGTLYHFLWESGKPKVLIMRRESALIQGREGAFLETRHFLQSVLSPQWG